MIGVLLIFSSLLKLGQAEFMVELFKVWNLPSFILLVGIAEFIIALWSGEYLRKNIKIDESEIKLSRIKVK